MSSMSWFLTSSEAPVGRSAREALTDYRARLVREEHERVERRRAELADQRSSLNPPDVRIRTWEKVHGLRLPSDPNHPILDVVAIATRLTLDEVLEEQRTRAARGVSKPHP
jgi:hypothetical protein